MGWVVNAMFRSHDPRERELALVEQEAVWARGLVWMGAENCVMQMRKFVHWTVRVANMIYAHESQVFSLLRFLASEHTHTQLEIRFEANV